MKFCCLSLAIAIAACSSGPKTDLPAIKAMRSAAAEWALVNREAERARLTSAYANGMRQAAREEIARELETLKTSGSPAAAHALALERLPPDAASQQIASHSAALQQIEEELEAS